MFTIPEDAPNQLSRMLRQWQEVSAHHKPTKHDFPFDDLVSEHRGLFWVERTDQSHHGFDIRFIKAGPEVVRRNQPGLLDKVYSEFLSARAFAYVPEIFGGCLKLGQPHYWDIISSEYGERPVQYQRLLLPLFDDQGIGVSLLGSSIYSNGDASSIL